MSHIWTPRKSGGDIIRAKGMVEVWKIFTLRDGGRERQLFSVGQNTIVDQGFGSIVNVLAGQNVTTEKPNAIAVGTDATPTSFSNTALVDEQFRKALTQITPNPSTKSVRFDMLMETGEPAPPTTIDINEVGLMKGAQADISDMIARDVLGDNLVKDDSFSVEWRWTFTFSRV